MAKKLYKENKRYKIVSEVSKYVSKNGKLKCKDKKKKKALKAGCMHEVYNDKGKLKGKVYNNGDGTATCLICGARFRIKPYEKEEVKEDCEKVIEAADQVGYIAVKFGFDSNTVDFISQMKVMLHKFPKICKKVTNAASKKNIVKKKKKKGGQFGSSQYGSWTGVKRL